MEEQEKEEKDSRDDKLSRILTGISMLDLDEFIQITPLSDKVNCHKNTLCKELEKFGSMKDINFEIVKDKEGNIKGILKTDEKADIRKELREIKKELSEIKKSLKKDD